MTSPPHRALRLSVREVGGLLDPVQWAGALGGGAVVLTGRWAGGGAVAALDPIDTRVDEVDPFSVLDDLPALPPGGPSGVGGGWFGWFGFEAGASPALARRRAGQLPCAVLLPTSYWALYPNVVRYDAATGRCFDEAIVGLIDDDDLDRRRRALVERLSNRTPGGPPAGDATSAPAGPLTSPTRRADHEVMVAAGQEHIAAGDVYQVNLCLSLSGPCVVPPGALYDRVAAELAPEFGAFVDAGPVGSGTAVVSASPELFLRRHERVVSSAPIKGTRPRPADTHEAGREAHRLADSVKDRAENIMITDLVRNDLSRVAEVGSVRVDGLLRVEPHPGVWHLVSEVHAQLAPDTSDADLLRATFPPGSVTGAPKERALEVIAQLEGQRRGVYTGAIGYASPAGGLELNVAIRTLAIGPGRLELGVGGGITSGSRADEEWLECFDKARAVTASVGAVVDVADIARR